MINIVIHLFPHEVNDFDRVISKINHSAHIDEITDFFKSKTVFIIARKTTITRKIINLEVKLLES